jgi:hypothetical protein
MTTPNPYGIALAAGLVGGVRDNVLGQDFTADCQVAMSTGMDAETRRRQAAAGSPGLGYPLALEQPPSGPGIGLTDVPGLEVVGEGYGQVAEISAAVHKAYGEARPVYGVPEVGGLGYMPDIGQPARRHVSSVGDSLLIEPYADGRQPGGRYVFASPVAKRGLLARLAGKLRRR